MIRLPIFKQLDVDGYGMYPGTATKAGLAIDFNPGLTLILGVNGLGKTTLVTILYRMCTGAFQISGLATAPVLGTRSLEASKLSRAGTRVFATRVADDATDATATLRFSLGDSVVELTRSLKTLALTRLVVDGEDQQPSDDRYQELVEDLSGLPTFGDWILMLRYLTFYFEDRRALVWDPTAQRQILRLLLLPEEASSAWATKEREVLELDSRVRNLRNALNREEGAERRSKSKAQDASGVVEELKEIDKQLSIQVVDLEKLSEELPALDEQRQAARLRTLSIEQEHDSARAELEELQLRRIASAFPSGDETARYLMSRLLSQDECQTCGSAVPELADELAARIQSAHCVVCDSDLGQVGRRKAPGTKRVQSATDRMDRLAAALEASTAVQAEAEGLFDRLVQRHVELDHAASKNRAAVAALVRKLPPDEKSIREQSAQVSSLRGRLEGLQVELETARVDFENDVRRDMLKIAQFRGDIIEKFRQFAQGFLFETSDLRWAPHKSKVGQTGPLVDFPAFEFELAGSDFPSAVRRNGPDQVSESQREFVDLAFRMALMSVAADGGSGSIVIDAPESSLDAVFSERAATVLVRFADPASNSRLIVTSNLVDGQLIPRMLAEAGIESVNDERLVDLIQIATPTQAVRELADEYEDVRDRMFKAGRSEA